MIAQVDEVKYHAVAMLTTAGGRGGGRPFSSSFSVSIHGQEDKFHLTRDQLTRLI
jgi:hypothetical protein